MITVTNNKNKKKNYLKVNEAEMNMPI